MPKNRCKLSISSWKLCLLWSLANFTQQLTIGFHTSSVKNNFRGETKQNRLVMNAHLIWSTCLLTLMFSCYESQRCVNATLYSKCCTKENADFTAERYNHNCKQTMFNRISTDIKTKGIQEILKNQLISECKIDVVTTHVIITVPANI